MFVIFEDIWFFCSKSLRHELDQTTMPLDVMNLVLRHSDAGRNNQRSCNGQISQTAVKELLGAEWLLAALNKVACVVVDQGAAAGDLALVARTVAALEEELMGLCHASASQVRSRVDTHSICLHPYHLGSHHFNWLTKTACLFAAMS